MASSITIVIPCYNSGAFLPEALTSIKLYSNKENCDVIIVNDGSTDDSTLVLLNNLEKEGYKIIHQDNKGPAAARNAGVKQSNSEYILFLDSDNKIRKDYIEEGISVFEKNSNIGVVYGNPNFFGETTESRFSVKSFDMYSILIGNYIDMCSLVRRKTWEDVNGLDENRILIGFEDWEFWIRIGSSNWKFHHIDKPLYDYRVRINSLVKNVNEDNYGKMLKYVHRKHYNLYVECYQELYKQYSYYKFDQSNPFRSFIKYLYKKIK